MESKGYPSKTAAAAITMQNQKESTFDESSVSLGNRLSKILFNSSSLLTGDDILIKAFKIMEEERLMQKFVTKSVIVTFWHCDIVTL